MQCCPWLATKVNLELDKFETYSNLIETSFTNICNLTKLNAYEEAYS